MNKDNIHVALVTPWQSGGGIANYGKRLQNALEYTRVTVTIVPIMHPETWQPWRFNETAGAIPSDADVVHVQYEAAVFGKLGISGIYTPSFYARLAQDDRPVVTTLHEVHDSYRSHSTAQGTVIRARDWILERIVLGVSDAIVIHTDNARETLQERHGEIGLLERMRHPVDDPVAPPMDPPSARQALDLDSKTILTTFGWVESKKRYEDVVRCLPRLNDAEYLIAGEPRRETDETVLNDVFNLAERLDVHDRVHYLGYILDEELPILFGATDLTIVPYEEVTQSGAVNTSLAYHCPVVTSALPAFEELATEYECILTYNNPKSLEEVIRSVGTQDVRRRLRASAEHYTTEETWSSFATETVSVYEKARGTA